MLVVPSREMSEFPHLPIQSESLLDISFIGSLDFLDISKTVAKPLSGLLLMIPVVSHTEPAELILTLGAGHVHAPRVLLNIRIAFWAGLS